METKRLIKVGGLQFSVEIEKDLELGPPWKEHDGHGVVIEWTSRKKRPGEKVLWSDRGISHYYDVEASTKKALEENWGAPGTGVTPKQRAAKAVEQDFERLRQWCAGIWEWVGVVVTLLDTEGQLTEEREILWGIESDSGEYLEDTAKELAGVISERIGKEGRAVGGTAKSDC